jgi:hypothetical protein
MPPFLVEVYAPRSARLADLEAAARSAAQATEGVHYLESILVPEDETCFHLFEGPSAETVCEAASRGALVVQRVSRADGPSPSAAPARSRGGAATKQPGSPDRFRPSQDASRRES